MSYLKRLLGPSEAVRFQTSKHWTVLLGNIVKELVILVGLGTIVFTVEWWSVQRSWEIELGVAVVALVVLSSIALDVLRWRSDQFIVTDRRVIRCSGIVNKDVLDSSLSKINDVALRQSWLGRLLDYGTLEILTASEEATNRFERIARPIAFKLAMLQAKDSLEPQGQSSPAAASAGQMLEELASLKARQLISDAEYQEKRAEIVKRM